MSFLTLNLDREGMMKWTVKVVSETESGHTAEQTLVVVDRTDQLRVEDLGLSRERASVFSRRSTARW